MRVENWESQFQGVLHKLLYKGKFKHGKNDCVTFVIENIEAITGKKVFKFALVPLKAGAAKLPAFTFSYFDPAIKDYRQAQTHPIEINVRPSSSQETSHGRATGH